jgi:regulator of protease activity HflC (stomatin/prohibitin superfamily)
MASTTVTERNKSGMPGGLMLLFVLGMLGGGLALIAYSSQVAEAERATYIIGGVACLILFPFFAGGFFIVNPNEARVLQRFGNYKGTAKKAGFHWVGPFMQKRSITLRVRNFESEHLKVNDLEGNPIEIASVVVWRVVNTAEAIFHVDNYENFVKLQTEAAVRNLASRYPYDAHDEKALSLRANPAEISDHLKHEIHDRLAQAGVEVIEARISHLSYAPEIAQAMLQRQQAGAIIAARQRIVEGAVGMVEMALDLLNKNHVVTLDEERKATMVSNLLVVLCGERGTQPVVNTGSLYR